MDYYKTTRFLIQNQNTILIPKRLYLSNLMVKDCRNILSFYIISYIKIVYFLVLQWFCVAIVGLCCSLWRISRYITLISPDNLFFPLRIIMVLYFSLSHTQQNNNNKNITWTFPNNFSFRIRNVFTVLFC